MVWLQKAEIGLPGNCQGGNNFDQGENTSIERIPV